MVSFSCEACGDVLTKKKLDPHRNRCHGATFTCIDCMVHFTGTQYRTHTSCITEDQKYQGSLYKNKNKKTKTSHNSSSDRNTMAHTAYVEDAPDEYDDYDGWEDDDDTKSIAEPLPEAPTPPNMGAEGHVNVFDFLVANATPNASNFDLPHAQPELSNSTDMVRYEYDDTNDILDPTSYMMDDEDDALVAYGTGPVSVPHEAFATPAPKSERKKAKEGDAKKDKKRKRLHVDVGDHPMTDAPPVLHSGLTGGLNKLMSAPPAFPPSPESVETPASPLKKSKHSKHTKSRTESIGNNLMALISSGSKSKSKSKKRKDSSSTSKKHHRHRHRTEGDKGEKSQKMIEYRPGSREEKNGGDGQLIVYKPRAEVFLGHVNKGPESERGCSMNKALKRFHRERNDTGTSLGKLMEEKELWRSLRLKRNEAGEIVLFCV